MYSAIKRNKNSLKIGVRCTVHRVHVISFSAILRAWAKTNFAPPGQIKGTRTRTVKWDHVYIFCGAHMSVEEPWHVGATPKRFPATGPPGLKGARSKKDHKRGPRTLYVGPTCQRESRDIGGRYTEARLKSCGHWTEGGTVHLLMRIVCQKLNIFFKKKQKIIFLFSILYYLK